MTNANDARKAHELLDELDARAELSQEQEKLLRSFLPERPKDATLDVLLARVHAAWLSANPSDWGFDTPAEHHDWLFDLRNDLVRILQEQDTPAAVPALPAGMRLADHAELGRVVVSPTTDEYEDHRIFYLNPCDETGAKSRWASVNSLTFIDAEPAKPAHPEFLETEADYQKAPEGTIVACAVRLAWTKERAKCWTCSGASSTDYNMALSGQRYVLRWGWGK